MIMIICGLPGVGKTTVAKELAPLVNAVILSTDKIRKELLSRPMYGWREKRLIYDVMILTLHLQENSQDTQSKRSLVWVIKTFI